MFDIDVFIFFLRKIRKLGLGVEKMAKLTFRQKKFIKKNPLYLVTTSKDIDFSDEFIYQIAKSINNDLPKRWAYGTFEETSELLYKISQAEEYNGKTAKVSLFIDSKENEDPDLVIDYPVMEENGELKLAKLFETALNDANYSEAKKNKLAEKMDFLKMLSMKDNIKNDAYEIEAKSSRGDSFQTKIDEVEDKKETPLVSFDPVKAPTETKIQAGTKPSFKERKAQKVLAEGKTQPKLEKDVKIISKDRTTVNNETVKRDRSLPPVENYINQLLIPVPHYIFDSDLADKTFRTYEDDFVVGNVERQKRTINNDMELINEVLQSKSRNILKNQYKLYEKNLNYEINQWISSTASKVDILKFSEIQKKTLAERNQLKDEVVANINSDRNKELEDAERRFKEEQQRINLKFDKLVSGNISKIEDDYKKIENERLNVERSKVIQDIQDSQKNFVQNKVQDLDIRLNKDVSCINDKNLEILSVYKKQQDSKLESYTDRKKQEHIQGLALFKEKQAIEQNELKKQSELKLQEEKLKEQTLKEKHEKEIHELEVQKKKQEIDNYSKSYESNLQSNDLIKLVRDLTLNNQQIQVPKSKPAYEMSEDDLQKRIQEEAFKLFKEQKEEEERQKFLRSNKTMKRSLIGLGIVTVCAVALSIFAFVNASTHHAQGGDEVYSNPKVESVSPAKLKDKDTNNLSDRVGDVTSESKQRE